MLRRLGEMLLRGSVTLLIAGVTAMSIAGLLSWFATSKYARPAASVVKVDHTCATQCRTKAKREVAIR